MLHFLFTSYYCYLDFTPGFTTMTFISLEAGTVSRLPLSLTQPSLPIGCISLLVYCFVWSSFQKEFDMTCENSSFFLWSDLV